MLLIVCLNECAFWISTAKLLLFSNIRKSKNMLCSIKVRKVSVRVLIFNCLAYAISKKKYVLSMPLFEVIAWSLPGHYLIITWSLPDHYLIGTWLEAVMNATITRPHPENNLMTT